MGKLDALGRATFHHIASHEAVRPTNRELRWLALIDRHGPQPSAALIDLTKDTHRCRDTSLRALQRLRAGGLLLLPPQQRATERAEFNPYIYDITPKGRIYLDEAGQLVPSLRPSGHWWHAYTVGALTAAIDRMAVQAGISYLPPQTILDRKGVGLGIRTSSGLVIPDQLFALDYGGSYRAFLLEVDRGTEPHASRAAKESLARKIREYTEVFSRDLHRQHYGLRCPIALLFAFTSKVRVARFLNDVQSNSPTLLPALLVQALDPSDPLLLRAASNQTAPWQRASGGTFDIFAR